MAKYIYHYFNARARGETARLVCAAGDIDYEDRRFEFKDWTEDMKSKFPFQRTPVLEVDGEFIDQSVAISRFLARKAGLAGSTNLEAFKIDAIADTITEIREGVIPILFEKDAEEKKKMLAKYIGNTNKTLINLENYLKSNKGGDGYFVGDKLTWADLHFVAVMEFIAHGYAGALKGFTKLEALDKRVRALPKVAVYIAKRPETPF